MKIEGLPWREFQKVAIPEDVYDSLEQEMSKIAK